MIQTWTHLRILCISPQLDHISKGRGKLAHLGESEMTGAARQPMRGQTLPISQIPNFYTRIHWRRRHIVAIARHGTVEYVAPVGHHFGDKLRLIGRPEGDSAVVVANVQDPIGRIACQTAQGAVFGDLGLVNHFAQGNVQILQVLRLVDACQQKVMGQVVQFGHIVKLLQTVQLDALIVVHVSPLPLGQSEHFFVLHENAIRNLLLSRELAQ